ncbi:hypothetical protein LTR64_005628 [Lithohypha guttulata]|uniref:uncharacterized protein n=1 Tax=Lithohypha guttulata TaxID=1690604 RepID=UPI002DDF72B7|nr:glycerol-3-phosphate dehydrogenase [Lithohypha guttulata]
MQASTSAADHHGLNDESHPVAGSVRPETTTQQQEDVPHGSNHADTLSHATSTANEQPERHHRNGHGAKEHDFSDFLTPAPAIASSRYNRQMLIPSISVPGQERISSSKVLIIGLGGLGSPAALYLAGAGVGKLGLLDNDVVESSNLHRQVVHRESSVVNGMTKVQSAIRGCRELNSEIEVVGHDVRLDVTSKARAEAVFDIVAEYDIVLDCTDNPATRYLISDLCVLLGKTLVSGAAQRLEGQVLVLNYPLPDDAKRGPCYRCMFPNPPSPEMVKGCGEIGILGSVVGTIGTLMASETLRLIVKGQDEVRKPNMLLYNAWPTDPRSMFRSIGMRPRRTNCVSCGDEEVLAGNNAQKITKEGIVEGQLDYVTFCGIVENIKLLSKENRLDAAEFLRTVASNSRTPAIIDAPDQKMWQNTLIVDTRERHEVEMGPQMKQSVNFPFSKILQQDSKVQEISDLVDYHNHNAVVFLCQRGNDSQIAAQKLTDWRKKHKVRTIENEQERLENSMTRKCFIGDVIGGFTAIERV